MKFFAGLLILASIYQSVYADQRFKSSFLLSKDAIRQKQLLSFQLAKVTERQNNHYAACNHYQSITNLDPASQELINYNLARCSWQSNDWPNFKKHLVKIKDQQLLEWIAYIIVNSISKPEYYKIFLSADVNFLLEQLPNLAESSSFNLNYLKLLKDDKQIDKILFKLWLIADKNVITKSISKDLREKFKKIIKDATLKDWEKYFQYKYYKKDFKAVINESPGVMDKFKYSGAIIKYYLLSLQATRRYKRLLNYLKEDKVIFKFFPSEIYELQFKSTLALRWEKSAKDILQGLKNDKGKIKIYQTLTYLMLEHYFYYEQDYKEALRFSQLINPKYLSTSRQENLQWQKLLLSFFTDNFKLFQNVEQWYNPNKVLSANLNAHFCYWLYVKGAQKFGQDATKNCFELFPNQYYGLRVKFDENLKKINPRLFFNVDTQTSQYKPQFNRLMFIELLRISSQFQEYDLSEYLLFKDFNNNQSLSYLKTVAESFAEDNNYYLSQNLYVRGFEPGNLQKSTAHKSFLKNIYPLAYKNILDEVMPKLSIPTFLVLSIMREESHYNPQIVSSANAKGLMQIIDATARFSANKLKLKIKPNQYFDPKINITLGANYLNWLVDDFKGNIINAIASYNAGPNNVKKWLDKYPSEDIDFFIEQIPYGETRRYVKRVLRSYFAYQLIYR